jgi:hypothetical protein
MKVLDMRDKNPSIGDRLDRELPIALEEPGRPHRTAPREESIRLYVLNGG